MIGTTELLLIGGMALLLFGGKKLPEMMRGLGQGVKEFKKGMNEISSDSSSESNTQEESIGQSESLNDQEPEKTNEQQQHGE